MLPNMIDFYQARTANHNIYPNSIFDLLKKFKKKDPLISKFIDLLLFCARLLYAQLTTHANTLAKVIIICTSGFDQRRI